MADTDADRQKRDPRWQDRDTENFLRYGRFFVPEREEQMNTIAQLLAGRSEPFHVLDLACGEGLLAEQILQRFPQSMVHGYDASPAMLEQAQERLSSFASRFQPGLFQLEAEGWRKTDFPVAAVVSSLAVHHLEDEKKRQLYQDIQEMLIPGGQLIVADLIRPTGQEGVDLAAGMWDENVRRQARREDDEAQVFEVFEREHWNLFRYPDDPIDKPAPLFDQLVWLDQAGFVNVDVYWLKAGHALFGGRKAG